MCRQTLRKARKLGTQVRRPYLERVAQAHAVDFREHRARHVVVHVRAAQGTCQRRTLSIYLISQLGEVVRRRFRHEAEQSIHVAFAKYEYSARIVSGSGRPPTARRLCRLIERDEVTV